MQIYFYQHRYKYSREIQVDNILGNKRYYDPERYVTFTIMSKSRFEMQALSDLIYYYQIYEY